MDVLSAVGCGRSAWRACSPTCRLQCRVRRLVGLGVLRAGISGSFQMLLLVWERLGSLHGPELLVRTTAGLFTSTRSAGAAGDGRGGRGAAWPQPVSPDGTQCSLGQYRPQLRTSTWKTLGVGLGSSAHLFSLSKLGRPRSGHQPARDIMDGRRRQHPYSHGVLAALGVGGLGAEINFSPSRSPIPSWGPPHGLTAPHRLPEAPSPDTSPWQVGTVGHTHSVCNSGS